jgi:N4-gp56 family major capsid protein
MAFELVGTGGLTVTMKQFYERRLLMRVRANWTYNDYALKKGLPSGGGRSIEFRTMVAIANSTTALTEGTAGAEIQATFTNVQATLSQYGQYALISDVADKQSFDKITPEYIDNLGEAMADSIDILTRNIVRGGSTVQYASTATTRATVGSAMLLTTAEIREAIGTLKRNNAKPVVDGLYVLFMHTDAWEDLMADTNLLNALQYAQNRGSSNTLFTGKLPDYLGVRFIESTNGSIRSSLGLSGMDVYESILVGKEFYGVVDYDALPPRVIAKPPGTLGAPDYLDQLSSVGYKAAHAAVILNENFGVRIEHGTTQSTAA